MNKVLGKLKILFQGQTLKSMIKNALVRPLSIIISLIYTPILLNYLGDTKYGIWMTILSIISWVNFADIGIGNGARNMVASELSKHEYDKVKRTVSTAYIILSAVSIVLIGVLIVISFLVNWQQLLNTDEDLSIVMAICFSGIVINFALGLGKSFLYALQLAERVSIITLLSSIIQLLGVIVLDRISEGNLIYLSILFGLSSAIVFITNDIYLAEKYTYFRLDFKAFDKTKIKPLYSTGVLFLILQIGGIVMYSTDNVLVSNIYGPQAVTPYSSVYRFFSTIVSLYTAFITPIWSRSTMAIAQNDAKWLKKTFKLLNYLMIALALSLLIISIFYKDIARIWLGKDLNYYPHLIFTTAICTISEMFLMTYSTMLNGMNLLKTQVYVAIFQSIVNIPLSYFLATAGGMNVIGIKFATLLLMTFGAIVYAREIIKAISKMEKGIKLL